jgi:hypothetical protein
VRAPLSSWPGVPFGRRRVLAPEDDQGLWGPRDHGVLHVPLRWPHESAPGPDSVRWTPTTIAEVCHRLPSGATLGVGAQQAPVRCERQTLERLPAALDVRSKHHHLTVTLLPDEDPFVAVAVRHGAASTYRLHARGAGLLLLAVREPGAAPGEGADFAADCREAGLEDPAQLWDRADVPRWLRGHLDRADEGR